MAKDNKIKGQAIRYEQWTNCQTGEIREFAVIDKDVQNDCGFHKVWIEDLAMVLGVIGGQKIKVFTYILNNINPVSNEAGFTYQELEKKCNVGYNTVVETITALLQAKFMKKVRTAAYKVNPRMLVKGNSNKRQSLMIIYDRLDEPAALTASQPNLLDVNDAQD